jgi:hypothetical protein
MTKQEKRSIMAAVVQDWKASGLSQQAYARNHNFNVSSFRYWITKFQEPDNSGPAFIQLNNMISPSIHIRYPYGVELTLPMQVPVEYIKSLVQIQR